MTDTDARGSAGDTEAELALLREISRLSRLDDLLGLLASALTAHPEVEGCLVNLLAETGDQLVCRSARLPEPFRHMELPLVDFRFPLSRADVNVDAFRRVEPVQMDVRQADSAYRSSLTHRFSQWDLVGVAALPLADAEGALGTVTLLKGDGGFSPEALDWLQCRLALFLPPLRLLSYVESLRRREDEIRNWAGERQQFLDFINEVNRLKEADQIHRLAADEFMRRYPFDLVGFLERSGDHLQLREVIMREPRQEAVGRALMEHYRADPFWLGSADGATPLALLQQSCFFFRDVQEVLHLPMSRKDRRGLEIMGTPRTFFIVPLSHHGEARGVLWLMSLSRAFELPEPERQLIRSLCGFLGTALANAEVYSRVARGKEEIERVNESLRDHVRALGTLATTDRLTGLLNFAAFQEALERHVAEHDRAEDRYGLSLLVIDVDHFKRFNDSFGHQAGNEVLQRVAQRIKRLCRHMDLAFRYGGEEFVVILPKCDLDAAAIIAERIRYDVESRPVFSAPVTVSIGCATRRIGEPPQALFERADRALYRAKSEGRNRVAAADDRA